VHGKFFNEITNRPSSALQGIRARARFFKIFIGNLDFIRTFAKALKPSA
jgi:hypothetical protein